MFKTTREVLCLQKHCIKLQEVPRSTSVSLLRECSFKSVIYSFIEREYLVGDISVS